MALLTRGQASQVWTRVHQLITLHVLRSEPVCMGISQKPAPLMMIPMQQSHMHLVIIQQQVKSRDKAGMCSSYCYHLLHSQHLVSIFPTVRVLQHYSAVPQISNTHLEQHGWCQSCVCKYIVYDCPYNVFFFHHWNISVGSSSTCPNDH